MVYVLLQVEVWSDVFIKPQEIKNHFKISWAQRPFGGSGSLLRSQWMSWRHQSSTVFEHVLCQALSHCVLTWPLFCAQWGKGSLPLPMRPMILWDEGSSLLTSFNLKDLLKTLYPNAVTLGVQFSSVTQSCPTPCNHMDCSTPGLPVHH